MAKAITSLVSIGKIVSKCVRAFNEMTTPGLSGACPLENRSTFVGICVAPRVPSSLRPPLRWSLGQKSLTNFPIVPYKSSYTLHQGELITKVVRDFSEADGMRGLITKNQLQEATQRVNGWSSSKGVSTSAQPLYPSAKYPGKMWKDEVVLRTTSHPGAITLQLEAQHPSELSEELRIPGF